MGKLVSVLAVLLAIVLYAWAKGDDSVAGFLEPAAFGVAFFALVLVGRIFGAVLRFPLQILMILGCWLLFADSLFTENLGVAALYLELILCIAATVSYYHSSFSKKEKRLIYGLFALAAALPAVGAVVDPRTFDSIFGVGSSRPMIVAAVMACSLYASALIAWLPHPKPEP